MPPIYKSVSKEEFYKKYSEFTSSIPFSLLNFFIEDIKSKDAFKNENLFILNEENGRSLLHEAAIQENIQLINLLNDIGHDINLLDKEHKTPLYDACNRLKLASVEVLLDYGADPNLGNSHLTLQGNRYEDGINKIVSYQGETIPLVVTMDSVRMIAFERLEKSLNRPYTEDSSDLAIGNNSAEQTAALIVEKLIQKGANVNLHTGPEHFPALHRAITYKYISLIKVIINSNQANPYLTDCDGETALHIVANYRQRIEKNFELTQMQKEKEIAELIIPYFNTLEIQEIKFGNTPLHSAVIRSNKFVVKLLYQKDYLFRHRKILSIQNKAGNTALHEAVNAAKQGPQILKLLLRVATNDELAVINKAGKTALQLAEDLLRESDKMDLLMQNFKKSEKKLDKLIDSFQHHMVELAKNKKIFEWKLLSKMQITELQKKISSLSSAITDLKDNKFFNEAIKEFELINDVESLFFNLKNYDQLVSRKKGDYNSNLIDTADRFHTQALKLVEDIDSNFLDKSYLESLTSVRQEEYFSWKAKILELPSSFPELINVDSYSKDTKTNFNKANQLLFNAQTELTKTNSDKKNIEAAIELYQRLKNYRKLEDAYQILAKITINQGRQAIADYEEMNRNKALSSDHQAKLQGHLALAELYKEVLEQKLTSPFFLSEFDKVNELLARKSYYFYQAYKLTEGHLDNTAQVVLQRELGITHNAKLGTYNIQQCIAVIAFDPVSKKVVLSHFDKFSGPLSFIDQLLNEFPDHNKINLYLSGARDRISRASRTSTISDNNIEQVLKQIFAEKERFVIRSSDLGDKLSPEAIVFDIASERLIHAVPNFPDASLESREVNFQLQWIKGDYLRPLNRVDFSKKEIARKISFSIQQQQQIYQRYQYYKKVPSQTEAWNNQIFYPLMVLYNELEGIPTSDYKEVLLTVSSKLNVVPRIKQGNSDVAIAMDEKQENRNIVIDMEDELDPQRLPCLIMRRRRKRDLGCVLDSELLFDYLKSSSDSQYAETLDYLASKTIGGAKKEAVSQLIYNDKIKIHLEKVSQFSSKLTNALFAKDALGNLLKGDPSAAINLGAIIGSNHLLVKTAERIAEKGTRLLAAEKILPGQLLRASSPFVARGTSLLFAYDLYNQIKILEKDSHDTDAWVNAASDGIFLSMDALQIGIEVAEFSSEAIAALEVSSITNPVGAIIGGIIILGVQIYESVKKVARENELVRLMAWEKFKEGCLAFLVLEPEGAIKKMMNEAIEYNRLLEEKREFLKKFPEIKFFVFPAFKQVSETCRDIKVNSLCIGKLRYMKVLTSKSCLTKKVCTPKFNTILDNWIYFKIKRTRSELKLPREVITPPSGTQLLCLPTTEEGIPPPPEIIYRCDGALGLNLTHNTEGKAALYDLSEGEDRAFGFDDTSNIFIVNNGKKCYVGGYKEDIFIVNANKVVSAFNPPNRFCPLNHLKGGLDGEGGIDTLNLKEFKPTAEKITIDLNQGFLKYDNNPETLAIKNIENLVGGEFPLLVIVGCDTQKIDITGGSTFEKADAILVPENSMCYYTTNFYLKPNIRLTNEALQGHFTYIIQPGTGIISVNLPNENTGEILSSWRSLSQHHFVFNADVSDLYALSSTEKTITFHFSEHKVNKIFRAIQTISMLKSNITNAITLEYQFKPDSFLDKDHLALLPKSIESNYAQYKLKSLLENYDLNSTVIFNDRNKIHQILFYFIKNSGFIPNDFKVELNFYSSNNFFFHFIDGTEIKIVNSVNYLFHNGGQNLDAITAFYSPIARRLNMICNILTRYNQRILVGHYGHYVVHNDQYAYETHIVSNGGQVLLVMQPVLPPIFSTLNEVVLHHSSLSRNIDTLDFRQIKTKIQTDLGINSSAIKLILLSQHNTHSFLLLASKEKKKLENDLLLILAINLHSNTFIDIIAVRLKDALLTHWYQEHLHIILNVAPLKIVGNFPNLSLNPVPLVLEDTHEFISIGIEDVEENTEIIMSRKSEYGKFYHHNKTNLIYTNTLLSFSTPVKPLSIILQNFYNEPKLATLTFKFSNKKMILLENLTALNTVENFESVRKTQEEILNKESYSILTSKSIQQTQSNEKKSESNTQNLTRQRRSIRKSQSKITGLTPMSIIIGQKNTSHFFTQDSYLNKAMKNISNIDSAQEKADDYYDRYDRMKEKSRCKKKVDIKIKKKLTMSPTYTKGVVTKQPISVVHKSKNTANRLSIKKPISSHTTDLLFVNTRKTTSDGYQKPSDKRIMLAKTVHFNENILMVKQDQTKLKQSYPTASIFKKIINKPESYLHSRENPKARLKSRYQSHQQWQKSEGISHVTASSDLQSTLIALNFVAKCLNKENNRAIVSPKIRQLAAYKRQTKILGIIKP